MSAQPLEGAAPVVPSPRSIDDVDRLMNELGRVLRQISAVEDRATERKAAIDSDAEAKVKPLALHRDALAEAIQGYATLHRDELTENGRRQTVELRHGSLRWHAEGSGTLVVDDEDAAIAALLKRRGGKAFLRQKWTLDKNKLKEQGRRLLAAIGARVVFKESFTILPKPLRSAAKRKTPLKVVRDVS